MNDNTRSPTPEQRAAWLAYLEAQNAYKLAQRAKAAKAPRSR